MRLLPQIFLILLVVSQLTFAQTNTGQETGDAEEVIRVNSHLVAFPVNVVDKSGKFVTNLRREDFTVFDNGIAQNIEHFESAEQPFSVLLLLDTSGSTQARLNDIKQSAMAFVKQLKPADRVLPVAFDMEIKPLLPDWTSDQNLLLKTIENTKMGVDFSRVRREVEKKDGKEIVKYYVYTRLYDAVDYAIKASQKIRGRKAIILLTDGKDTGSKNATYKNTLREVQELDALFYTIQYDGFGSLRRTQGYYTTSYGVIVTPRAVRNDLSSAQLEADKYLESLAEKSGTNFQRANDVTKVNESFAVIAEELRRIYTIGFYVDADKAAAEKHKLKIKVKQPKLSVVGRKTYTIKR